MNQEIQGRNQGFQPQNMDANMKTQLYAEQMNQSKVQSVVSMTSNPQHLLKFFQNYLPKNSHFNISKLHTSNQLKLKKYKQSVYYGEYINGKRHGKGIMLYDNGRVYQGNWECDYKHGEGFQRFPKQCVYQGDYVNGKPQGVGRYSWPNGQFYQGQWVNGMKHGSGMWRGVKGDSYIGQWKFGKADGYGVHTWVNGDKYEGEFRQCLKHGQGIQKFANGDIYKGVYANGKPSGFGQYYWSNGSYFKGSFKNGLRDGQGMWKRAPGNSDKYQGQYNNDKKSGYGIFTWATGNIYKGNYENDSRNGYGQMYWNDGSYYKGEWKNGIQNGNGQIYVPGQGFKKGIFQNNVLIILQKQSLIAFDSKYELPAEKTQQKEEFYEQKPQKNNKKQSSNAVKPSFRTRGYSSKNYERQHKKQEQISTNKNYGDTKQFQLFVPEKQNKFNIADLQKHQTLLPKKYLFNNRREQKYVTIQRKNIKSKPEQKQRILHSSFYMHKLHNRANTSITSKEDVQSAYSNSISQQYRKKRSLNLNKPPQNYSQSYTNRQNRQDYRYQNGQIVNKI